MARDTGSNKNKEMHRSTLLEYLSNPDNEYLNRAGLATVVLGFTSPCVLYHIFTPLELKEIEAEALELRRTMYGAKLAKVDQAVLKRAASDEGTAADAKLAYQRFENWSERQIKELVFDGPFLAQMFQIFPPEIAEQVKAALVARHKELT